MKSIIDGIDRSEEIDKIDKITSNQIRVKDFMGPNNAEIEYDKQFEKNCIILAPYANQPIKTLSTKEYFNLIRYVDEKNSKKK